MMVRWTVLVTLVVLVTVHANSRHKRDFFSCGFGGSCPPPSNSCGVLKTVLHQISPVVSHWLRLAACIKVPTYPKVCCPGNFSITHPNLPAWPTPPITQPITPPTQPITQPNTPPTWPTTPPTRPTAPPTPKPENGETSRCRPWESCTPLHSCQAIQVLLQHSSPKILHSINQSVCNRDSGTIKVCCPMTFTTPITTTITTPSPIPPTSPTPTPYNEYLLPVKCLSRSSAGYGISTTFVERQSFSWMAVLGYKSTTKPIWLCGGTLISLQYVLTAAHCVHLDHNFAETLTVVRLGELNLETETDCEGSRCAPPPQDFTPVDIIIHSNFNNRAIASDDIALIRLDRKAMENEFVGTLCLPPADVDVEVLMRGREGEVTGWGLTEQGTQPYNLAVVRAPFVSKDICNPLFDNKLVREQICFGGEIQDSCLGDTGGPLVVRDSQPLLVGIVSRGLDSQCDVLGVPSVYTDVAAYRSWIIQFLRP